MRRGEDEFGIESICEVGTPIIIDNKTGQSMKSLREGKSVTYEKMNNMDRSSIFDILS
jgi:hypothetical protein